MENSYISATATAIMSGTEYNYTRAEERWNVCRQGRLFMHWYMQMF